MCITVFCRNFKLKTKLFTRITVLREYNSFINCYTLRNHINGPFGKWICNKMHKMIFPELKEIYLVEARWLCFVYWMKFAKFIVPGLCLSLLLALIFRERVPAYQICKAKIGKFKARSNLTSHSFTLSAEIVVINIIFLKVSNLLSNGIMWKCLIIPSYGWSWEPSARAVRTFFVHFINYNKTYAQFYCCRS